MSATTIKDRVEAAQESLAKLGNDVDVASVTQDSISYFESEDDGQIYSAAQLRSNGSRRLRRRELNARIADIRQRGYKNPELRSLTQQLRGVAAQENTEAGKAYQEQYQQATRSLAKAVGMNTFEGDSAGSLVLPEFAPTLMDQEFRHNDLWGMGENFIVAGNSMNFPKVNNTNRTKGNRSGGVDHFWTGEEKTIGTARPGVDDYTLRLKKLAVVIFVTTELIEDNSYALEQYVTKHVRRELDFALDEASVHGTAVLQPTGWLNEAAGCTIEVAKENLQAADTVTAGNLLDMWARRITGRDDNYVWLMNQEVESVLPRMTLTSSDGEVGSLVYMPRGGLSARPYATLNGNPIITTEHNPGIGDRGDVMLVDYNQYTTIGKGGIIETMSPHVEFLRDQIAYKFTVRVDGRPCDDTPTTPARGTQTQSPCIVLAARG